ncbi:MAG: hypothetical protein RL398_905 [Planctomycetota bacterium]
MLLSFVANGCGAGLVTGIAASNGGNGTATPAPELSLVPILPLVPPPEATRVVVVANAQIAATSLLRVRIEAAGVVVDQRQPTAVGQGNSTSITYTLDTAPILAALPGTDADVAGVLRVLVDDKNLASAPITLARQPAAALYAAPGGRRFLSPFGERVELLVEGLRSSDVANVQMLVRTPDPTRTPSLSDPTPTQLRVCTDLTLVDGPTAGTKVVGALVPGSAFPCAAELLVRDVLAGESTVAQGAYVRPDIAQALPSQGPTTGGSLVTLVGSALVPYAAPAIGQTPILDFAAVSLRFAKGGRVLPLSAQDFRVGDSSRDRLVFTMPNSPDGRAGQVDVVLEVQLPGATAQVTASQVFLYANPQPFFGPRGTTLDRLPVAVTPIALDGAPSGDDAPDFAALYDEGGVAFVQLLLAQENGMFTRFGAPRQIADHEVAAERGPADICAGDFDGDAVPDLFLVNGGEGTAVHHVILGQAKPAPPLGAVHRFAAPAGSWKGRTADFDGDGLSDIVVLPGDAAAPGALPEVWLARPIAVGQPAFARATLPVRALSFEAMEIADLDGDGPLDIAVVSGATLQLDVAYGNGNGTFGTGVQFDFAVPDYTPDANSPAVGIHACRDGSLQSLGLVLAGLDSNPPSTGPTRPTVALLRHTSARNFAAPTNANVFVSPTEPLAVSLAADLDQANSIELALAVRGDPQFVSFGLLRLVGPRFEPRGTIEAGAESPRQIRALHFDRAFPATPLSGEAKALFVVHESELDGGRERRLSTRLIYTDPVTQDTTVLPPDAGAQIGAPIEGLASGNFHEVSVAGAGSVRDLALGRAGIVDLLENDGFGGFPRPSYRLLWSGLVPSTLQLLPSRDPVVEQLVFANADSRLATWLPLPGGGSPQVPTAIGSELRAVAVDPVLQSTNLSARTQIAVGDVDGDGLDDLAVLLCFAVPTQAEGTAQLALLRGKAAPAVGEFPFYVPTALQPVHGNASSLALGDFAADLPGQPKRLELAVAVPTGTPGMPQSGNHVRFYRYHAGASAADDRFVASARTGGPQVLLAGSGPTRIVAADLDRDQSVDLLVAAATDSTLRLFRNVAEPGTGDEVAIGSFQESLGSPRALAAGEPQALRLADVNGDGSLDAVAAVQLTVGGVRSTVVVFYLSTGAGEFATPTFVSPTRVGDRDATMSLDLGDWNRDGVLDLFLGWATSGPGDRNLRVLFGGTR